MTIFSKQTKQQPTYVQHVPKPMLHGYQLHCEQLLPMEGSVHVHTAYTPGYNESKNYEWY